MKKVLIILAVLFSSVFAFAADPTITDPPNFQIIEPVEKVFALQIDVEKFIQQLIQPIYTFINSLAEKKEDTDLKKNEPLNNQPPNENEYPLPYDPYNNIGKDPDSDVETPENNADPYLPSVPPENHPEPDLPIVPVECSGGTGTPTDPIRVCTPQDLDNVRNNLTAHYIQIKDIDLAWQNFEPIGTEYDPFMGGYNGNKKTIKNLKIYKPEARTIGLFSTVENGLVENLRIANFEVTGLAVVGGIAGQLINGSVSDSMVFSGKVNSINSTAGGIAGLAGAQGLASATITRSSSQEVEVSGTEGGIGGLIGSCEECNISESYVDGGSVKGGSGIGGLVGILGRSKTQDSYSNTTVTGDMGGIGGFTGVVNQESLIEHSFSKGKVFVSTNSNYASDIGGFAGANFGIIKYSFSEAEVYSPDPSSYNIGGLIGGNYDGDDEIDNPAQIFDSYATGSVTGGIGVGGLVGSNGFGGSAGKGQIFRSYSTGKVSSLRELPQAGGLVGREFDDSIVENSYWDMDSSGQKDSFGGEGRTTAQMTSVPRPQNTYVEWDFVNIWGQDNGSYPFLR